ncbi:MAG: hypothetical protein ACOYOA_09680 [Saprospiraceae bacterium]
MTFSAESTYKLIGAFCLTLLFLLIANSGSDSYFNSGDESGYFANQQILFQYGFSTDFLRHFSGMAGPLHPILHWILSPLTGGIPPGVRFVNFVILLLILWQFRMDYWHKIVCIPMTFICAGYAMTELPAMFFLLLSIHLLRMEKASTWSFLFSGLCLSLAVAGRWNYLLVIPAFYYLVGVKSKWNVNALFVFIFSSLIFPLWIIYAWQGISPPEVRGLSGYGFWDVDIRNFILSGSFAALIMFVLSPHWYVRNSYTRVNLFIVGSLTFAGNGLFHIFEFLPAKSVFDPLFGYFTFLFDKESAALFLANGFGSLSITIAYLFYNNLYAKLKKGRDDAEYLFFGIATVLILLSTIKITHVFSSRYPYQALPFLLFLLLKEEKREVLWWEVMVGILGAGWGITTWFSYQHIYF